MPSDPVDLAREGDLEALLSLRATDAASDRDVLKWLLLASDCGHDEAEARIDDWLESSSLRCDDSGFERAAAHWELAVLYLEGTSGVARDLGLAAKHLELAFRAHDLDGINEGADEEYDVTELLQRLPIDARTVLARGLEGDDFARAARAIDTLRRLVEVGAPVAMVDDQRRALRELVRKLCPAPTVEQIASIGREPLADELRIAERDAPELTARLAALRAEWARRGRSS